MTDIVVHGGVVMTRRARTALQKQKDGYPLAQHEQQALARLTDPATSHEAAATVQTFRARHEATIYCALQDFGAMTHKQIALRTGLEPVQVARRGKAMEARGLVTIGPDLWHGCRVWRVIR